MISRRLVDLLNSGEAVSIVGSGISADAGLPSWDSLFNSEADALDREKCETRAARTAAKKGKLPEAFDLLAVQTSRMDIHARAAAMIKKVSSPGKHHTRLADWPFRLHITTNYDQLFESAWKLSCPDRISILPLPYAATEAAPERWLFKMHGCISRHEQIVLTRESYLRYDEQLPALAGIAQAFLLTRHMLFVGFSFNDDNFHRIVSDVRRLLRIVAQNAAEEQCGDNLHGG